MELPKKTSWIREIVDYLFLIRAWNLITDMDYFLYIFHVFLPTSFLGESIDAGKWPAQIY